MFLAGERGGEYSGGGVEGAFLTGTAEVNAL